MPGLPHPLTQLLLPVANQDDQARVALTPSLSRRQFAQAALRLAHALQARNITRAALWFEDAALMAIGLFACWRARITATLAGDVQAHTCATLTDQVDIWLSDQALINVPGDKQWCIAHSLLQDSAAPSLPGVALDPEVAVVLCTSGSSGVPKPVPKRWWQLLQEVQALQDQWPLDPDEVACVLGTVSVQHMYGLPFRLLWPLATGVPIDRWQRPYPEALQHASLQHERCVWIASPALLCRLGDRLDWTSLRGRLSRVYCAGGVLPTAVSDLFAQHLGARPIEIYGSSETGVIAWRTGAQDWRPFAGVVISCNDAGALHVCSPWLPAAGEQTADAVTLNAKGFQLQGRLDRIVKIEGKRIALPMLERALMQHSWVAQAHLGSLERAPVQSAAPVERLAALIALSDEGMQALRQHGRTALIDALRTTLMGRFEPLSIPRIWRFFAHLPSNAQGKVTKALFEQAVRERPVMPEVQALPRSATDHHADPAAAHERHYRLRVPCDLVHFGGHFPAFPVVPGVAQISWAMALAQQDLLPQACPDFRFGNMEVLKFQRLLRPDDIAHLTLRWDKVKRKLHFAMTVDGSPCSSGRIVSR